MSEKILERTDVPAASGNGGGPGHGATLPDVEAADGHQVEPETREAEKESKRRSRKPLYVAGGVLVVAAVAGFFYWLYARQFESTDDAFIDGEIVQVSPKISAYVARVAVKENQFVKKGDLLVELAAEDSQARLELATAQLQAARAKRHSAQAQSALTVRTTKAARTEAFSNIATARNNVAQSELAASGKESAIRQALAAVKTAEAALAQAKARVPQAESGLKLAEKEQERSRKLFDHGAVSRQSLEINENALSAARAERDAAARNVEAAAARVDEANAAVATAEKNYRQSLAQIALTKSQVDESAGRLQDANAGPERLAINQSEVGSAEAGIGQAEAALRQAELEAGFTKIYAPMDGFVTRKNVNEGQLVQPGAALMAISQRDVWVLANFKETQLDELRVGQPVEIWVDAYPGRVFRGKIESFQAGTGSRFSVLPSENASGNFVKVVQRVPVKIVFDEKPDDVHLLVPGMSVQPRVRVR